MKKTNFDRYLEEQLKATAFAGRFKSAGEAWDARCSLISGKLSVENLDIQLPPGMEVADV
ncbi:MAG: hypothetical protein HZA16_02115 [Nitrospirae bacterium]|nr:hypothetical protein [Nitrospirota bacterium]